MKITIIEYGGKGKHIECNSFEFRCNQVSNWIMIKTNDTTYTIHDICAIKVDSEEKPTALRVYDETFDNDMCGNCLGYINRDYNY